jgi:pilus assembly protein CpaD
MKLRLPSLLLGLSALGACASVPEPPADLQATPSTADYHRITVTETAARLEVPIYAGTAGLSPEARNDLRSFADSYLRAGHGALILSTPTGSANAESAAAATQDVRLALTDAGVSFAAIAGSTYEADRDSAPILVTFARFEAVAPDCRPLWEQDLAHQSNNQAWESFGCATQANLAALIEDPRDLLGPRTEDPRDGGRRSTVIQAYRAGEQTHAERSDDERITISNAVQ